MGFASTWLESDEQSFRELLSPEARALLVPVERVKLGRAWDGIERRSDYHQATRVLVGDLLRKVPAFPFVVR